MTNKEKEWVKVKVERTTIAQINAISTVRSIGFEDLFNVLLVDGLAHNQPDFLVQNEYFKRQRLAQKIAEIYTLKCKKPQFTDDVKTIFELIMHFFVDLIPFLRKNKFTKSDILLVSKVQDVFKYVQDNYPDDYSEIKQVIGMHGRTKTYKLLFSQLGTPNLKTDIKSVLDYNTAKLENLKGN